MYMGCSVLEKCKISPPADAAGAELSLPVLFFDMVFYDYPANQSVLLFEFPCSKSNFLETVVPDLKQSLSLTLTHFLPLAGNIIHPLNPENKPVIRYTRGDSVSLTVSESKADLHHLTGNHPRVSDEFYGFAPELPPAIHSECSIACPVLALKVTLFPGQGICIGFVTHHAVADASTVVSFMQAWALINRSKPDGVANSTETLLIKANLLPFYDRKNALNIDGLDSVYWDLIVRSGCPIEPPPVKFPIDKIRSTFVLKKDEIQKLKDYVLAMKRPGLKHLSSFTITCAFVWVCTAKAALPGGEVVADDEPEYFGYVADCRGRLMNPPLPANYFGNCVALGNVEMKHGALKGRDGFAMAVESIGEAIRDKVYGDKGILHGAEYWPDEFVKLVGKRQFGVAGSPRFDFYAADYGWGRPNKFEPLFIDGIESVSLFKSREFEGGLEIGVSKPKAKLEAFTAVFNEVLTDLLP